MEGSIVNFRGRKRSQRFNQLIVLIEDIKSKEDAEKYLNKKVRWLTKKGKEINGFVKKPHGNSGALLVEFEKGLPGQALGTKVKIEI